MTKTYKEYIITAEPFNVDLISSLLWELDITGINEDENLLKVFSNPESGATKDEIIQQLKKLQSENLLDKFSIKESVIEEKNWNEEWEKSLNIIHVTERIIVKPTFKEYDSKGDEIVITIDPKMSFGTGEHATTKLIIQMMENYIVPGMKVLDSGTGTGILAILSVKLGALRVIGFDIDEWCFENAKENCLLNNVSEKVEIRGGEINVIPESNFDLILANIQKNILLQLKEVFYNKLIKGGFILLSGLLKEDEKEITAAYSGSGFSLVDVKQMDEWIAMTFRKL